MSDDGEVLRFRPRGLFEDPDDHPGPYGTGHPRGWYPDEGAYGYAGLGELTRVVLAGDQVVDVAREPVSGSGYECAVLELLDRGLLRPPRPAPPPVPPGYEQQLAWLARIVGGDDALGALDVEPLEPDAELCLDDVRPSLRDRVRSIDVRLEQWAPVLLGDEGHTATRRLLTRAVALEPALLRSDRDDVATGAVLWAVAKGNDLVGHQPPGAGERHPGGVRVGVHALRTRQRVRPRGVGRRRDAPRQAGLDVRHPPQRGAARQPRSPALPVPPHLGGTARHLDGAAGEHARCRMSCLTVVPRPDVRMPPVAASERSPPAS